MLVEVPVEAARRRLIVILHMLYMLIVILHMLYNAVLM